jgi:hypothetical protein
MTTALEEVEADVAAFERAAPYERQPDEPHRAFQAFRRYRDLGPTRTLLAAYRLVSGRVVGRVPGYFSSWANHWGWHERAGAWDAEVDRQLRGAELARLVGGR